MALNLRATIEGSDIYGNNAEIRIYLEGFAGAPVTRKGASDFFEIQWGDSNSELLPNIYGAQLTARFFAETDYEFLDLFTVATRECYIEAELTDTNELIFCGYTEPAKWSEPLIAPPYEVSLTAYDGLGLLTDEEFLTAAREYYEGTETALALLQKLLAKTGLTLPLNTAVNIRPVGELTYFDSLTQYKKDQYTYRDKDCYEVLEQLFVNVRIFQRLGKWYAISNDNWEKTNILIYQYNAAGAALGSTTINPALNNWWIEEEATLEMMPPIKQMKITQDYGFRGNLIENGNFNNLENGSFANWTAAGVIPEQRKFDDDGNTYIYLPGSETTGDWENAPRSKYLRYKAIPVFQTDSVLNAKVSYALMGPEGSNGIVMIGIMIAGDNGINYYLGTYKEFPPDSDPVIGYQWYASSEPYHVPLDMKVEEDGPFFNKQWEREIIRTAAKPWDKVTDNFKTASIIIPDGIPNDGQLYLYLYLTQDTNGIVAGNCFRGISLKFTDEDDDELPTNNNLVLINNTKNTFSPDDLELLNGDVPDTPNKLINYHGTFLKTTDNSATTLWQLDGHANTYSYAELMARLLAAQSETAKQSYHGTIADVFPRLGMVITDPDNSNKKLVEAGVTYNFRMNRVDGRYVELTAINLEAFTVTGSYYYTRPSGTGSNSGNVPTTPVSTDEKIALLDDTYVKTKTGYLYDGDFVFETDPTTGRTLFKIAKTRTLEIAAGTINGVNKTFTISKTPVGDAMVFIYPMTPLLPGTYTIVDKTITLGASIVAPVDEERILIYYDHYIKES